MNLTDAEEPSRKPQSAAIELKQSVLQDVMEEVIAEQRINLEDEVIQPLNNLMREYNIMYWFNLRNIKTYLS